MKILTLRNVSGLLLIITASWLYSCSKGGGSGTTPPVDPCDGKTITVTPTITKTADPCDKGTITVTATGSTNFTFSIDGGAFQASGTFANVIAGSHSVTAKDGAGCAKAANVTMTTSTTAGTLFTAVKSMMQTNCAVTGCHNGTQTPNFTDGCNITANWNLIKARAVDAAGTSNQMPQPPRDALSQADRNKITDWVNAGHTFSD